MSQYKIYAPLAINAGNFEPFKDLLIAGSRGAIMPDAIASYAKRFAGDAFREIKGAEPLFFKIAGIEGAYTQVLMWTADASSKPAPSKMALLFLDAIPAGPNKFSLQPRQWIIGADVQALIPYQMTCCSGVSAVAVYKQDGRLHPALLENPKFVRPEHRDLFGLTNGAENGGIKVDHTGDTLRHWHAHLVAEAGHSCAGHASLSVPARGAAFRPS